MVLYSPHWRFVFEGKLYNSAGPEIFSCSINCGEVAPIPLDPDAYLTEIAAGFSTWFSTAANKMSSQAWLTSIKMNHIGSDGKYSSLTSHRHDYAGGIAGAYGGAMPLTTTVAYSWRTILTRGPGHTGRIYPPVGIAVADQAAAMSPVLSNAAVTAYVTSAKNLLNVVANTAGVNRVWPGVFSSVGAIATPISSVRVGNVMDNQRRRRDQLPEVYTTAVWP